MGNQGKTYKKPTEYSAQRTLERFFSKHPNSNSITKAEIFAAWDRDKPEYDTTNEGWLSNKLTGIYTHGLARPVYTFNPWKKLERLELTAKGKTVLGREDAPVVETSVRSLPSTPAEQIVGEKTSELTIDEILQALPAINAKLKTHQLKVVLVEKEDKEA